MTACVVDSLVAAGWLRSHTVPARAGCGSAPAVPGRRLMIHWILAQ